MEDRACEVQDTIALFDDVQKHLTDEHTAREVQHLQLPRINSCITSRIYKCVSDSWNKFAVKRTLHYSLFINALHQKVGKYNLFCRGAYTVEYSFVLLICHRYYRLIDTIDYVVYSIYGYADARGVRKVKK